MEMFSLIVMAVGSWALVISLIIVLGKLNMALETPSRETDLVTARDTEKVVSLARAEEEGGKADLILPSAA